MKKEELVTNPEELQDTQRKLEEAEKTEKANEKAKKRLKRKIVDKNITIVILIVIIIILLMRACGGSNPSRVSPTPIPTKSPSEMIKQPTKAPTTPRPQLTECPDRDYVTLPVVSDFSVSSAKPEVTLYSPVENEGTFLISFTFIDASGRVIYESDYEEGGEKWNVNITELLPVGENNVKVKISSQYQDTGKAANGSVSDIKITVKK